MAWDVIIAGAGPAGTIAATVLARAGARVLVLDRARFPRHKLCGDSINPGACALLERLHLGDVLAGGLPISGMVVSGEGAVRVVGTYPPRVSGISLRRAVLDARLADAAGCAGAEVEDEVLVRGPVFDISGRGIAGVEIRRKHGVPQRLTAPIVIGADGHASRLARPLRLSRAATSPRRWAAGAYFEGVSGVGVRGEMHVRQTYYIGVAPVPGELTNACLVSADRRVLRLQNSLLHHILRDPALRERFARARLVEGPVVLGPLGVDADAAGMPGLLLAGDAAGFIDPMTGDGVRFAMRGGELAALEALRVLAEGWQDAHVRLTRARRRDFGRKWRFNRTLRAIAGQPGAVRSASVAARLAPHVLRRVIAYAGDV